MNYTENNTDIKIGDKAFYVNANSYYDEECVNIEQVVVEGFIFTSSEKPSLRQRVVFGGEDQIKECPSYIHFFKDFKEAVKYAKEIAEEKGLSIKLRDIDYEVIK